MDHERDPGWQYLRQSREIIAADQSKPYDSKKDVWIPDNDEGYIAAQIKSEKGDTITIITAKGNELNLKKEMIQEMNPPKFEKTEDMSNLSFLNDASVLHNLRQRYVNMLIYTYSGLFCIVVNPYKRLPIYTDSVCKIFMGKRRNEVPPHLFAVSDEAYRNMLQDNECQSMLITGESGAGKTENTKKVIAYFAMVGASQQTATAEESGKKKVTLEDQIVQTNPVLEAFGNAKTVRNNNSSRFGKFIRIYFNGVGKLTGCDIEHYLLEKSRVIRQAPGERCYHIFYQIMSGHKPKLRAELELNEELAYYHFVSQAELKIDGVDDQEEFKMTDEAFDILKFSAEEKQDVYRLCSSMMHMGEMKFKQRPREEQAEADGTEEAEKACKMLDLNHEELLKALTKPRVKVGNDWVNKGQNLEQVNWSIGAMVKAIYARIFDWLVRKCNQTLEGGTGEKKFFIGVLDIAGFETFDLNSFEQLWIVSSGVRNWGLFAGRLLIDCCYDNSQSACFPPKDPRYNFVNENLQQFFNHHMFVLEQEEYAREGIQWTFIDFGLDLAATIELIEKPLGIISMLDEECIVPKATDLTFAQKLIDQHLGKHPKFTKPKPPKGKQSEAHFALIHYAGTVILCIILEIIALCKCSYTRGLHKIVLITTIVPIFTVRYNVTNWLEKNKDPLNDTAVSVMKTTKGNALLQTVWADYTTQEEASKKAKEGGGGGGGGKKGKSASMMTVSSMYRESLNKLMTMLHTTHPHFIRCIIPNERKTSGLIEAELVLNQLTCNGVLEGIRICRKGFPNRMIHSDFRQRYSLLAAEIAKSEKDPPTCAGKMLDHLVTKGDLTDEQFRNGKTKVFFKAGVLAHMEDIRDAKLSEIMVGFQAKIRYYNAQSEYRRRQAQQVGLLVIQRNIRSWCTLRTWEWFKLYGAVKPMLKAGKEGEEMDKLQVQIKALEDNLGKEEKLRQDMEGQNAKLIEEKNALFRELEAAKGGAGEAEQMKEKLIAQKKDVEKQLQEVNERLSEQEERCGDLQKSKKKLETDCNALKKSLEDVQLSLRKSDSEKGNKDVQIRSLQDEMARQDEAIAKLNKEKKQQEEMNRKLTEDLQSEENKVTHVGKLRSKLEQTLDEAESNLEHEKHVRQDVEKAKRKLEGELKLANDNIDELNLIKHDLEGNLKKKESDLMSTTSRLDDESALVARLQRQIKEEQVLRKDVEEELENERQNRSKVERTKSELQRELEELSEQLDEAGGATSVQVEMNKKREAEIARLRRESDEKNTQLELQMAALKKKHNDAVAELSEQLDQANKSRSKLEKEKQLLQKEVHDSQAAADTEGKGKGNLDRINKQLQQQLSEMEAKYAEQSHQLHEATSQKARLAIEVSDFGKQLEDAEQSVTNLSRLKTQFASQLDSAKIALEEETRERQNYASQCRTLEYEVEQLRDQVDSDAEARNEVLRQLNKANLEVQQWRAKFETEGMSKAEELEESKRKLTQKLNETRETLEAANGRIALMEKNRLRTMGDLDDAQVEAERANAYAQQMEKKQKQMDKVIDEWRKKVDDVQHELSASQQEARNLSTDVFRLKATGDDHLEMVEALRRENKGLAQEIKDLADQLGEGGRSVHDTQKLVRRLEIEKEELQILLNEAEAALEAEETKVMRSQIEVTQIRQQIEKRVHDKEEEFENTRRNHQRALESMQASLESETKNKNELLRIKKKLECDINDLEIGLDHANRANSDAQKNLKKYQEQIRELQMVVEDEQRQRNDMRERYMTVEKRNTLVQSEKEELVTALEQADRARKQAELQANECQEQLNELTATHGSTATTKRQLEADAAALKSDLDDTLTELRACDDRAKKAAADAARLAEELRAEQEHALQSERLRKTAESTVKELQLRLDEAGSAMLKGGQKSVAKLEARTRQLEQELDSELRRTQEANKNNARLDRRVKELQLQIDDEKKNRDFLQELIDQLQQKVKVFKKQAEEAEELASLNLQKYKSMQQQLDDAVERADFAENALTKMRTQSRSASVARSSSRQLLPTSSGAVMRSSSRPRQSPAN